MDADLDTLATALYATADNLLNIHPERVPARPVIGFGPLLGFTSEARWIRHVEAHLTHLFPYVPQLPGYTPPHAGGTPKRLRKLADTMAWLTARLVQHRRR